MLRRKRLKLDEKDNVIKYGLFYIGLRDETYYWECLVSNGRKIAISVIIASIHEKQAHTQLMIAFTLLYANHQFIKQVQPYQEPFLNNMDLSSSRASLAGVHLGAVLCWK